MICVKSDPSYPAIIVNKAWEGMFHILLALPSLIVSYPVHDEDPDISLVRSFPIIG